MRIENDMKLGFKDVMFRPKRSELSSRSQVDLNREYKFKYGGNWRGVPIIAANMDTTGSFEMAHALSKSNALTAIHKHYSVDEWADCFDYDAPIKPNSANVCISMGISDEEFAKTQQIIDAVGMVGFICLDVANGYTGRFVEAVKRARQQWPDFNIIAGNVVTAEMTEELILAGADVVKVGIGPGSVCTTRVKTGVGYPQLSAIIECADAVHGLGGHIIADGGCSIAGDVAKAFGAGADFVMLGGMLAGHDESAGEVIYNEFGEPTHKLFYGMSSDTAMNKHNGGVAKYRASEGKTIKVPYRGPVEATLQDILGGIRSTCTYVGAAKLKELSKRTTFVRVSEQENRVFS